MGSILDRIEDEERNKKIDKRTSMLMIEQMMSEVAEDTMKVFAFGAAKHPDSGDTPNFLTENGNKCSVKDRGSSCLRHSAELLTGRTEDEESGLHPALHLISSAAILYARHKRGIIHTQDK